MRGANSSDGSNSDGAKDDRNEEDGGVIPNLNLGDSFIWESPSLCTWDWWDETRTCRILVNKLTRH